jgi:hypothetical protein
LTSGSIASTFGNINIGSNTFTGVGTGLTGTAASLNIGGNAGTATTLQSSRTINGVSFNGSASITINAASSTLLGDTNTFTATNTFANIINSGLTANTLLYANGSKQESSATVSGPLSFSAGTLSISKANGTTDGYLAQGDWTTFNNKISSTSLSATYPLAYNSSTGNFSLGFGTTTSNTFSALQIFNGGASTTNLSASGSVFAATFNGAGTGLTGTAASLSIGGNANTATTLQTARTINGVSFDGSGNITINAASSTLLANSNTFSGTNSFTGNTTFANATTSNFAISGVTNSILSTNANGSVVATTSIGTNLLTGTLGTINGTPFNAGSSITVGGASTTLLTDNNTFSGNNSFTNQILGTSTAATRLATARTINGVSFDGSGNITINAASSTLLANSNTFSGNNIFSSLITGSVSGNAGTATTLQTARTINGVSFDGSGNITINAASSTLLANSNTFSGNNSFTGQTGLGNASSTNFTASGEGFFATASTTNLILSGLPNAILSTNASGQVVATTTINTNSLGGVLTIAHGGTATSTQFTNGVNYFDGTQITSGANLTFDGSNFVVAGSGTFGSTLAVNIPTGSLNLANLSKTQNSNDSGAYQVFQGGTSGTTVRGYLGFTHTGSGGNTFFTSGELADSIALRSQGGFQLGTGGNNIALTIDTAQQVGIGTTTPGSILSINGVGNFVNGATSTLYKGLNLTSGCFSIGGTCLSLSNLGGTVAIANGGTNATSYTSGQLLSFNGTSFVSTSTIGNNQLANSSLTINGTSIGLGSSGTITAASSTLLANNNTFSGNNIFSSLITGSISGNANTVTNGVYTTTFNNLFDNRLSASSSISGITTLPNLSLPYSQVTGAPTSLASSTLLSDNNTFSGSNSFSNTITGSISGNAGTATVLQTSRTINGVSFNGSGNITINAASSSLLSDNNTFSGKTIFGAATSSSFAITGLANTLLSVNANGTIIATSTIGNNQLQNSSLTINGTNIALGGSGTITAASSTLLANNNTWTGLQTFGAGFITSASSTNIGAFTVTGALGIGSTLNVTGNSTLANASSTNFTASGEGFFTTASTTNLTLSSAPNAVLSTNSSGQVVATTSIGTNYLTGVLGTINGASFSRGGAITVVAASSSILSDNNTFSGTNTFSNTITGSISGNAGTVTNGVYTTTFNGLADARFITDLAATSSVNSITTLGNLAAVGTLTSGSIASTFGNINIGSNTFTGVGTGLHPSISVATRELQRLSRPVAPSTVSPSTAPATSRSMLHHQACLLTTIRSRAPTASPTRPLPTPPPLRSTARASASAPATTSPRS